MQLVKRARSCFIIHVFHQTQKTKINRNLTKILTSNNIDDFKNIFNFLVKHG